MPGRTQGSGVENESSETGVLPNEPAAGIAG